MNWPDPSGSPDLAIADERHAHALDQPEGPDELAATLARRVAQGLAIYPKGGGTAMHVGGKPARPGVLVQTTALRRVLDYPAADMTITAEAGITLAALQDELGRQGQFLPLDTPEADRATLGGVYATNTWGPRRFGYGRPRDHIIGIRFATSAGQLVRGGGRVVKNVAGYDFPKLLTGSMGTLGVICEVTLKVRPKPEDTALALVPCASALDLAAILDRLNTSATRPVALDAINAPAAAIILGNTAPRAAWALAVGFEEASATVTWQLNKLREELDGTSGETIVLRGAEAAPVWSALTAFQATGPGPLKLRAGARPSCLLQLLSDLDPAIWAAQAHAGTGTIHLHASPDIDLEHALSQVDRLRAVCERAGGHLVVSACPSAVKDRPTLWGGPRPDQRIGALVKAALDPAQALNPGRFVDTI